MLGTMTPLELRVASFGPKPSPLEVCLNVLNHAQSHRTDLLATRA